jgi:DNA-binding IclR family transcriptional regulator
MYRLLSTLEDLGLVEPGVRRGTYRLGIKLLRMGNAVRAGRDERRAALPVMERIHELTSETVFLVVRRGDVGVCIERIDGLRVQSLALQLGGWLPLHAGAAMRVLLAYEPETEWSAYVRRNSPLERLSPRTPVTEEDLFAELTRVRKTGVSVSDEDVTVGIAAVGAPIFGESGQLVGALSASGVREYILGEGSRVTDLVADGARTISASLGWQQP